MPKVTLLHNMYIYPKNGVNTVINQLLSKRALFEKSGLSIEPLTLEVINDGHAGEIIRKDDKNSFKRRIKTLLNTLAQKNSLVALFLIYVTSFRPAKRMARFYLSSEHGENEVVFMHSLPMCYYYLKYRKTKQPIVVVLHSNGDNLKMWRIYYPSIEGSVVLRWLKIVENVVIEGANRISFVSEMSRNTFLKIHPEVNPNKVFFIHNGIEDDCTKLWRKKNKGPMEFCCVASISNRKGQQRIIEAISKFEKSKIPNVHFTFVGDGPDRVNMEKLVVELGVGHYFHFAGVSQNVDDFLSNSDAYILVSEDEGLPMGIIEAMKHSLPIVTTDVGGIPEMVKNDYNGVVIEPTVDSVYDFLGTIGKRNWQVLGENSRRVFEEKFTANRMVEKYTKILTFDI